MSWHLASHALTPTPCPRPSRRQLRDAGRLLTTQSELGNRDADRLTAELHRAGWDLRSDRGRAMWLVTLWTLAAVLVVSATVLGTVWVGGR